MEKYILLGSKALQHYIPTLKLPPNTDTDALSVNPIQGFDHHSLDKLDNQWYWDLFNNETILPLEALAAIKRSHLHRALSFDRNIAMYHHHLAKYLHDGFWRNQMERRQKLTFKEYPQGTPSLDKTNEDFFDDAVAKVYDHDWLHEVVAAPNPPMYTKLKYKDSKAWCEKELWDKLSLEAKIACVSEEVSVIAIERFLVPNNWDYAPKRAYFNALAKVCTTLTSGWFRDFAIDFYPEVVALFDMKNFLRYKEVIQKEKKND